MLTSNQVRRQFWLDRPTLSCPAERCPGDPLPPSVHLEFSKYVEQLRAAGVIDGELAGRITL